MQYFQFHRMKSTESPHKSMATADPGTVRQRAAKARSAARGRLRIGDDWNAITIIALSQDNPLKAVAEFVENSIDAGAHAITIMRGRDRGEHISTSSSTTLSR